MADDILRIGAEFDVSQIVEGSQQASESFDRLNNSALEMAKALQESGLSLDQIRKEMQDSSIAAITTERAIAALGATTSKAAVEEQSSTAATEKNTSALLQNADAAAAAAAKKAAAAAAAAAAAEAERLSTIQTRLSTDALTGNFARAEQALVRYASHGEMIGPIMQAAFAPLAALILIDTIAHLVEKLEKAAKAATELSIKWDDLAASTLHQADAMEVSNDKLQVQIDQLEGHPDPNALAEGLSEAKLKADDLLKSLESDTEKAEQLLEGANVGFFTSLITGKGSTSEIRDALLGPLNDYSAALSAQRVAGELGDKEDIERTRVNAAAKLAIIKNTIKEQTDTLNTFEKAQLSGGPWVGAPIAPDVVEKMHQSQRKVLDDLELQVSAMEKLGTATEKNNELTSKVDSLKGGKSVQGVVKKDAEEAYAALEALNSQQEQAAKGADEELKARDQAAKKAVEDSWKEYDATQAVQEEILKSAETEFKARQKYAEESDKLAEESAVKRIDAQESAVRSQASLEIARRPKMIGGEFDRGKLAEVVAQQELSSLQKLEDEKLAIQMKYQEDQKKILLGGQSEQSFAGTADPAQLLKLQDINHQIETAQQQHDAKMAQLAQQAKAQAQRAADEQKQAYMNAFNGINQGFTNVTQEILTGQMTIRVAFERMWGSILMSTIKSLEMMILQHIEAAAEIKLIAAASALFQIIKHAAVAAAGAFASQADIPVIGPVLGDAAAADSMATVMGFASMASAQHGAMIPSNMPVNLHAGEMVLPERISTPLAGAAPAISKFNASMDEGPKGGGGSQNTSTMNSTSNFHISALDPQSFREFAHRNQRVLTSAVRAMVRNGVRR